MTAVVEERTTTSVGFPGPVLDVIREEARLNRVSIATVVRKYVEIGMAVAPQAGDQVRSLGKVGGHAIRRNGVPADSSGIAEISFGAVKDGITPLRGP